MADNTEADDDERLVELSSIQAIFPELAIDPQNRFSASLDLAVVPLKQFPVVFPPLADGARPSIPSVDSSSSAGTTANSVESPAQIRWLMHLPPLHLKIELPSGYPAETPPLVELSSESSWVPAEKIQELRKKAEQLWDEHEKSLVLYDYIDYLQQAAEDGFGLVAQRGSALVLPQELEVVILDYDLQMQRKQFEDETFDCGICLEPKKGAVCHKMQLCGHVFCLECLHDFYNNAIEEGDVSQVKCLTPDCEKHMRERSVTRPKSERRRDWTLDPSELLQISISQEKVSRYVSLKKKKRLESNKSTIYCPRKWCQEPARLVGQQSADADDSDSDTNSARNIPVFDPNSTQDRLPPTSERLAICNSCSWAFCWVCKIGWHGEYQPCFPRRRGELTAEEKATEEYLKAHSTPCPTCNSRCQKIMGCNHMICFQCKTHFCYLCSAWLSADNPYVHFNTGGQPCFMRLWELEEGDGVHQGPGQQAVVRERPPPPPEHEVVFEEEEDEDEDGGGSDEDEDDESDIELPPAPAPPVRGDVRRNEWQAQGLRVNRRVQQGLARPRHPLV